MWLSVMWTGDVLPIDQWSFFLPVCSVSLYSGAIYETIGMALMCKY